jgi:surface protein
MTFLNNAKLIKLGNGSEVLLMKLDGVIVYQKGLPLYIPYEYRSRNDIIEVKTMVTKAHTDLSFMFYYSTNLTTVDTTDWDTSNVTTMRNMFSECKRLQTLDTSNWDTSKVTDIKVMFSWCSNLTTLDLSNWDTGNVTDMRSVFYQCANLTTLDLSNWDTGNVTTMENMFDGCFKLISVGDISNWDTSNVTDMRYMFSGCEFETLDLSSWITSRVTNMIGMFTGCDKLQELNLSSWNMSNVDTFAYDGGTVYNYATSMFYKCDSLHTLRLDNCSKNTISKIINSSSLPTGEITDSEGNIITRKIYCKKANTTGLTAPDGWEFVYITPYEVGEYTGNTEITEVTTYINNTHTDLSAMFQGCTALTTVNTTEWDTSNVTTMQIMFSGCESLVSLDLSKFDTGNVTNMSYMFYQCYGLQSLDLSNFDMSNVDSVREMLGSCTKLHTLRLDNCSNDTIRKIVTSYNFPSGSPISDDYSMRTLYCKEENADGIEELLPSGWQIYFVD